MPDTRPSASDEQRVDELRQRLRSLGYLDAGVDRFVLGSARSTRRPAVIAAFASLRIGALAAILLGPAAAIGLSARMPGLVTGPSDAAVIAIYLGAFFGIAVACATALASLGVVWFSRKNFVVQRRLGLAAGALVTLGCLVYLTLWWQTVIAGVGWSAPIWTLSALTLAVAMSLLLGHAAMVASSAVALAAASATVDRGGWRDDTKASLSWPVTIAAGLVAFGAAALLVTWSAGATRAASRPPEPLTVVPSGLRVRVIAIDGFDPRILDELSTAGRAPALAAAFAGGGIALQNPDRIARDDDPARVWTTIATGQPPEVHGVEGLETRRIAGVQGTVSVTAPSAMARAIRGATDLVRLTRPAIASGSERRVKTFWEVAAGAGLRTAVVNWWATWPASGDAGIVITDRATLRLERGGVLDAELSPPELYEVLRHEWGEIRSRAESRAAAALDFTGDDAALKILRRSAELDALQLELLAHVSTTIPDVSAVYLPGLDIAQHSLLGDESVRPAPSELASRLEALRAYYAALDRLLAPYLTAKGDELVMIVTEPGRVRGNSSAHVALRGPIARTHELSGVPTALAPTVLYALGVPLTREFSTAPLLDALDPRFTTKYPVRYVSSYGSPSASGVTRAGQPLDQEMIDRLRSLGYVR
jgi:hypothetical protein